MDFSSLGPALNAACWAQFAALAAYMVVRTVRAFRRVVD